VRPIVERALGYARLGWPVLPVPAKSKAATLTGRGVKDASTDPATLMRWWGRWPDANVAVACGLPGPQVLDIDSLARAGRLLDVDAPTVATARGRHLYFAGQPGGTAALACGELRGRGSYVLAPPSIHPGGKHYVWLAEPDGPLPAVPAFVNAAAGTTWGKGEQPVVEQVEPGAMYDHLCDLATRLARAGIRNADVIERVLLVQFEAVRIPGASYGGGRRDTRRIAEWAAASRIAATERGYADFAARWRTPRGAA
jgi:putative DNA primase/helicase